MILHAKVVLSPHIYPMSVSNPDGSSDSDYTAPYLWTRLTNSFGVLTAAGYTAPSCTSSCTPQIFPVAVGAHHPPSVTMRHSHRGLSHHDCGAQASGAQRSLTRLTWIGSMTWPSGGTT